MKKLIIFAVVVIIIASAGYAYLVSKNTKDILGIEEAKAKVEEFINNNLMQEGKTATIKEVIDEGDLYKVIVDIGSGQDINSYLTKDGKKFFPQVMDIAEIEKQAAEADNTANPAASQPPASAVSVKQDKPTVEIYVMSHCPFGTQIEKGIIPVVEALGDKIDFSLKFCDYAMHDKKELDEQLRQHCIQKEQPNKLISYLKCFLEKGESESCLSKTGINIAKLNSCVVTIDKQFKVTEMYNNKTTWKKDIKGNPAYPIFNVDSEDNKKYGIGGSPGLVINGQKIQSSRDANSLLKVICSGFNEQPDECGKSLDATTPAPGFGFSGSGSDSSGGCAG